MDRYLLGSRYNERDGVVIKVRYLLQKGEINAGDEITIEYEDVLYHGLRSIDYTQFPSSEEEEGPTQKTRDLVGHALRALINGRNGRRLNRKNMVKNMK